MPHVIWSDNAQLDLQRAYHFLAAHDKQLAKRALKAIHDGARLLSRQPLLGHLVTDRLPGRRELYVRFGRSGYILQYELDGDDVIVAAIRHQRQARW